MAPPTQAGPLGGPLRPAGWPTAIGIIAIILGILDLLGGCMSAASPFMMNSMKGLMPAGYTIEYTPRLIAWTVGMSILLMILGGVLLSAGIGLLQRRAGAVRTVRAWAVAKILLTLVTVPVSYSIQQTMFESMRQQGMSPPGFAGFFAVLGPLSIVLGLAWAWAFPVFVLIWLARGSSKAEIAKWM
jgi:hypothetical protein